MPECWARRYPFVGVSKFGSLLALGWRVFHSCNGTFLNRLNMTSLLKLLFVTTAAEWAEQVIAQVRALGSAVKARQAATEQDLRAALDSERFDVLVLTFDDTQLPVVKVVAAVQDHGRRTPVIVLSTGTEEAQIAALRVGAFAALSSPNAEWVALTVLRAASVQQCLTQLHDTSGRLHEAERRCLLLFDSSRDPIAYIHDGRYLFANEAWKNLLQISHDDELLQRSAEDWVSPDFQPLLAELLNGPENQGAMESRVTLTLRNGLTTENQAEVFLTDARLDGKRCTIVRITSMVAPDSRALGALATRDPLTGLFNRSFLLRAMEDAFAKAAREESTFAFIEVALDANGGTGSLAVESSDSAALLSHAGALLREYFPHPAVVARLDDDSLAVLIPGARREALQNSVTALLSAVANPSGSIGRESAALRRLALGIVLADDSAVNAATVLGQAHLALLAARERDSERFCFGPALITPAVISISDAEWRQRLEQALADGSLQLVYQALINLHGANQPRFTVYLRLRASDGSLIPAERFIAAAERSGIAPHLDRWVLEQALPILAARRVDAPETVFFVKLSRASVGDRTALETLQKLLQQHRIPPVQVVLEIKENTLTTTRDSAVADAVRGFQQLLGNRLCVDEFGNSLDTFQVLRSFEADYLKLDPVLLQGLRTDPELFDNLQQLVAEAQARGQQVIAPLVEDAETLALLFGLGVNLAQGYFIHPPSERPDYDFAQAL